MSVAAWFGELKRPFGIGDESLRLFMRLVIVASLVVIIAGMTVTDGPAASQGNEDAMPRDVTEMLSVPQAEQPNLAEGQTWLTVSSGDDLEAVINSKAAGQAFHLTAGVYRLQQLTPRDGDIFYGDSGAILNGSRLLTDFSHEGSVWMAGGQTQERGQQSGYCLKGYEACSFSEDLFIDDTLIRRVRTRAEVKPGRWFFDYAGQRVILGDDPGSRKVELSQSRSAFSGKASNVTIRGLTIEKYAAPSQFGAIQADGPGWDIQANEVRFVHGAGVSATASATVRGNSLHHNGQQGLHIAGATDTLVEGNIIAYNNTVGFDSGWEAGGAKFVATEGLIVRGNTVIKNKGPGLWTDGGNNNTTYEGNTIQDNAGQGIFHEISYAATITNNKISGNGQAYDPWMWGGQIVIANSPNVDISGNDVQVGASGGDGIAVLQSSDRGTGKYGPHVTANVAVLNNTISFLGTAGTSGGAADINADQFYAANNRFDYNTYVVPDLNARLWEWRGVQDWAGLRAAGQEEHGSVRMP